MNLEDLDPEACPECAGIEIDARWAAVEGPTVSLVAACTDCGCRWTDFYRTTRREVILDRGGSYTLILEE